jgi:hypothetical protein
VARGAGIFLTGEDVLLYVASNGAADPYTVFAALHFQFRYARLGNNFYQLSNFVQCHGS